MSPRRYPIFCIGLLFISLVSGCTTLGDRIAVTLADAILNNNDLEMVEAGAPAYILLIDGLAQQEPKNASLALTSAQLYSAYGTAFTSTPERHVLLADKAFSFAKTGVCLKIEFICEVQKTPFKLFEAKIKRTKLTQIDEIYILGQTWVNWIQAHSDDWNAIADIAKVRVIMEQVVAINESHDGGGAHLYLGGLATLLPPSMGGQPERGRQHFERAIILSEGKNLLIKVTFAEQYARLMFNRALHDKLLNEVLSQPTSAPQLTLINTFAKKKAKKLLASADDYF
ncbi:MAG: hypothetical protein COB04_15820 [Gammaproteobacteria bacterium]|nr:MAG: hypothetical protein COB04_15820 [Gammaproteobacteria bacterium]